MAKSKKPTVAQLAKLHRLSENCRKTYNAWQNNHDKSKDNKLGNAWVKATKAADAYNPYK